MIQEYFQPKIGRKIRIFSLGRKNNILIKKKKSVEYTSVSLLDNDQESYYGLKSLLILGDFVFWTVLVLGKVLF